MSRTKISRACFLASSKIKSQISNVKADNGFTLIEMLMVVAIMGILAVIGTSFLISSLSGSGKAEILKEVRQNGDYALGVVESLILSSTKLENCSSTPSTSIKAYDNYGSFTSISCANDTIASNAAVLTGNNVSVSNCSFSCSMVSGSPAKVSIIFTVSQKGSVDLRTSEKASITFNTTVIAKNVR